MQRFEGEATEPLRNCARLRRSWMVLTILRRKMDGWLKQEPQKR